MKRSYLSKLCSLQTRVAQKLKNSGYTLSVAESATGGLLASLLTDIPGSSDYFHGGIIAYSNDIKVRVLAVPKRLIEERGAVSAETAELMAKGVRKIFKTDIAAAITGIAGPSGGTKEKPVGLVFIAVALSRKTIVKKVFFKGTRPVLKKKFAEAALALIRDCIEY